VDAERSLRFSVGWSSTEADVERAATALADVVGRLRALAGGSAGGSDRASWVEKINPG